MTLRVRCADDLIAFAPVALGFHPADDVVMLRTDGGRPFHARTDLPPRGAPPDDSVSVAERLAAAAQRNGVRSVALLLYGDERAVRPVWQALRQVFGRARIDLLVAVRVDQGRYFPLVGDRRWREIGRAFDVSAHPFVVEAALHGIVIAPDRAAVEASLAPDPVGRAAVQAAIDATAAPALGSAADRQEQRRRLLGLLEAGVAGARLSDAEVARLVWLVQDVRFRDLAWGRVDRAGAQRHQGLWLDVLRRTPDRYAPAPAVLLAWAAYRAGHGALAWIAVDRCRELDPHHRLAGLLAGCLDAAMPPDVFDDDVRWEEGLPA